MHLKYFFLEVHIVNIIGSWFFQDKIFASLKFTHHSVRLFEAAFIQYMILFMIVKVFIGYSSQGR